ACPAIYTLSLHDALPIFEPNEMLDRLQGKVEQAVQRAGQPPEKRKFKPHVTLARFKSHPGAKLESYFAERSLFRAAPFEVSAFRSEEHTSELQSRENLVC